MQPGLKLMLVLPRPSQSWYDQICHHEWLGIEHYIFKANVLSAPSYHRLASLVKSGHTSYGEQHSLLSWAF